MIKVNFSNGLEAYQKENGIRFTDSQLATLIFNSRSSNDEIYASLQELEAKTEDLELKKQIQRRMEEMSREWKAFSTNKGDAVYLLKCYEESDKLFLDQGYYFMLEDALEVASCFKANYEIYKCKIFMDRAEPVKEYTKQDYIQSDLGCARYEKDGSMISLWTREYQGTTEVFEWQYIPIRHPFRKGDIVQNVITGEIGIMNGVSTDGEMEAKLKRMTEYGDVSDATVFVEFINDDGDFYHEHVCPTELDFVDMEKYEGEMKSILFHASTVVRGHGSLEYLDMLRDAFKEKKK